MYWILAAILLLSQNVDHREIVAAAKAQTIAAGINPDAPASDECARFEVTKRVAIALQAEGAGVLLKPTGNNCQGFAVDIIAYKDGTIVDILGGGPQGPNTPMWVVNPTRVDPSRWAAPPEPQAQPPAASDLPPDITDLLNAVRRMDARLEAIQQSLESLRESQATDTEKIQQQINQVVKDTEKSVQDSAPLILRILSLGIVK